MRDILTKHFDTWAKDAGDLIHARFVNSRAHPSMRSWISAFVDTITDNDYYRAHPLERDEMHQRYLKVIASRRFLPTSAALGNFDKELRALAGCIVLPFAEREGELTREQMDRVMAPLRYGIGVGLDLGTLIPRSFRGTSKPFSEGVARSIETLCTEAGTIDPTTSIKHAALMGALPASHPDVFEFIFLKTDRTLPVINTSIAIDKIFNAALKGEDLFPAGWKRGPHFHPLTESELCEAHRHAAERGLKGPDLAVREGNQVFSAKAQAVVGAVVNGRVMLSSRVIIRMAASAAHRCGDPGIINLEAINRDNPTLSHVDEDRTGVGYMWTVTPCGEQPLISHEMCHLGSIDVSRHTFSFARLDSAGLEATVRTGVRMLDDVITQNLSKFGSSDELVRANRKIGVGIMGFADLLAKLRIPFDSEEALQMADRIGTILKGTAHNESIALAAKLGPYPNWDVTAGLYPHSEPRRNATTTTLAPTGFISSLAACNPQTEPFFSVRGKRLANGVKLEIPRPLLAEMKKLGYTVEQWIEESARQVPGFVFRGSLVDLVDNPTGDSKTDRRLQMMKKIYRVSRDIEPEFHLEMAARWQRYIDNGVSKTINMRNDASVEHIERLFLSAIEKQLKGITVYRDGSLGTQALSDSWPCISCAGEITAFGANDNPEIQSNQGAV